VPSRIMVWSTYGGLFLLLSFSGVAPGSAGAAGISDFDIQDEAWISVQNVMASPDMRVTVLLFVRMS
jgi:hypothetical protein